MMFPVLLRGIVRKSSRGAASVTVGRRAPTKTFIFTIVVLSEDPSQSRRRPPHRDARLVQERLDQSYEAKGRGQGGMSLEQFGRTQGQEIGSRSEGWEVPPLR